MKTQFKLMVLSAVGMLAVALTTGFLLAEMAHKREQDVRQNSIAQLRYAARVLVENLNEQMIDKLTLLIEREARTPEQVVELSQSEFLAVALLEPPATDSSGWRTEWVESLNTKFDVKWLNEHLSHWRMDEIKSHEVAWERVVTSDGRVYFALLSPIQVERDGQSHNRISLGVLPSSAFGQVNLITKGQGQSLFLVNKEGYSFSYPDQQYVGSRVNSHPFVARLMGAESLELSEARDELSGKTIVGGFERIGGANIFVVAAAHLNSRGAVVLRFGIQAFVVSVAIFFLVLFGHHYWASKEWREIEILKQNLQPQRPVFPTEVTSVEVESNQDERIKKVVRGLVTYLREPITALLGHLQIRGENKSEVNKLMLSELRGVRDFIEALSNKVGAEEAPLEVIEMNALLSQALSHHRDDWARRGIHLEENFVGAASVRGSYENLKGSLRAIMSFIGDFLSAAEGEKRVMVGVQVMGGVVQVVLEVRGTQLPHDVRQNLFSPYSSWVRDDESFGLGMALAQSAIRKHGGEIELGSFGMDGFRLTIQLPRVHELRTSDSTRERAEKLERGAEV